MNIRTRLTFRFIAIVAVIIIMSSILIYVFSADYREEDFYDRMYKKANNTAKLLIEVDEVDAVLLNRLERENPANLANEKIIVYDLHNSIIFSTDDDNEISVNKNLLDKIRLEGEVRFTQGAYEALGFLFVSKYDRFAVVIAAQDIYGFGKLRNLKAILFSVVALSVVVVSISGWFFAGRALKPISTVVNQVDEITITNLNSRLNVGKEQDEIAHLSKTFNNMLARLETAFKLQKNFIANASHELRTPLTAVTGQLEVTLLNTRTNDEYIRVINSVLDDIKNLNLLANRLLLLAQTSSDDSQLKVAQFRIDELIWQIRDELIKRNPSYKIRIDISEGLDDELKLTMRGDEQLIKTALLNVTENGCKYSNDQAVRIVINDSLKGLNITFSDRGIGILPEDLRNIFEPFYRGSNTQQRKGHGIGLSMVKRIVSLHRGIVQIESVPNSGTVVTIDLSRNLD